MNVPTTVSPVALPRVDVIVPFYRYGHLLAECVDSIRAQPGVEVRVLIIDDASPDRTAEVAARLARDDSRVEVYRHEHNVGHIATFNHGLDLVEAEFVALVSADDRLTQGSLLRAATAMRRSPSVGFVYGRAQHFSDRWRTPNQYPLGTRVWSGDQWLQRRCQQAVNVITSPEVVVRTSVHRRVGGYEPRLPHTADLHLWLRLASIADVAYLRGRTQAGYRVHAASLQRTVHAGATTDVTERILMFRHLAEHAWRDRPDLHRLMNSALGALSHEASHRTRRLRERGLDGEAECFESAVRTVWPPDQPPPPTLEVRPLLAATWAGAARRLAHHSRRLRHEVLGS